jgi:hypothetical protein
MKDAQTYVEEIVHPTIREFEREPASRRRAFLACVALFNTVDYLAAEPSSKSKGNLRKQFRTECADFVIVATVWPMHSSI